MQSCTILCNEVKTIQRLLWCSGQNMWQHIVCNQNNKQTLVVCVCPWRNLFTHFILRLALLSAALGAIGSTLGAATGLFRAGGMSTLHSLSEWRLTTCGVPPPTNTHHLAWSSLRYETHSQQHARECTDVWSKYSHARAHMETLIYLFIFWVSPFLIFTSMCLWCILLIKYFLNQTQGGTFVNILI